MLANLVLGEDLLCWDLPNNPTDSHNAGYWLEELMGKSNKHAIYLMSCTRV